MEPIITLRNLRMTYRVLPKEVDARSNFVNFEFGFGRVHIRVNGVPFAEIDNVEIDDFTETCSRWIDDNYEKIVDRDI